VEFICDAPKGTQSLLFAGGFLRFRANDIFSVEYDRFHTITAAGPVNLEQGYTSQCLPQAVPKVLHNFTTLRLAFTLF
jgi:hypothetical protein